MNLSLNKAVLGLMILAVLVVPAGARAQYYSQEGGKKTIIIDKKVGFEKGKYFDNLDKQKHVFGSDQTIYFQIVVENNGNSDLSNLNLKDMLPDDLKLTYNPGKYIAAERRLEWSINQLGIGQTKVFEIAAKISVNESAGQKTNYVEVKGDGVFDSDNARYWVGGKTMPKTGPGDLMALTAIFSGLGGSGLVLRKLIRGY